MWFTPRRVPVCDGEGGDGRTGLGMGAKEALPSVTWFSH